MAKGTHDYLADPRNAEVKISVDGTLYPRDEAKVSVRLIQGRTSVSL